MLLSHKKEFLFVHIQKTAGTSLIKVLENAAKDAQRIALPHQKIREVNYKDYESYYKFCFVRNPWDRLVSWYSMIEDAKKYNIISFLKGGIARSHFKQKYTNPMWRYVYKNAMNFDDFVINCVDRIEVSQGVEYSFVDQQVEYIQDEHGAIVVDKVGRFEALEEEFEEISNVIGIYDKIPHVNKSKRSNYKEYYNKKTKEIVRERFKDDIMFFGYDF